MPESHFVICYQALDEVIANHLRGHCNVATTQGKKEAFCFGIRRLSCHTPLRLLIASSMGLGLRAAGQNWQADLTSWPSHLIRVSWLPSVTQAGFV